MQRCKQGLRYTRETVSSPVPVLASFFLGRHPRVCLCKQERRCRGGRGGRPVRPQQTGSGPRGIRPPNLVLLEFHVRIKIKWPGGLASLRATSWGAVPRGRRRGLLPPRVPERTPSRARALARPRCTSPHPWACRQGPRRRSVPPDPAAAAHAGALERGASEASVPVSGPRGGRRGPPV